MPGAPGRGRNTWPVSNRPVSGKPRPMFRTSVRNSPGSRVVRSCGWSSLSGFATLTAGRRGSSGASMRLSASVAGANGSECTSTKPAAASMRATARSDRCRSVRPPPAVARGCLTGRLL